MFMKHYPDKLLVQTLCLLCLMKFAFILLQERDMLPRKDLLSLVVIAIISPIIQFLVCFLLVMMPVENPVAQVTLWPPHHRALQFATGSWQWIFRATSPVILSRFRFRDLPLFETQPPMVNQLCLYPMSWRPVHKRFYTDLFLRSKHCRYAGHITSNVGKKVVGV